MDHLSGYLAAALLALPYSKPTFDVYDQPAWERSPYQRHGGKGRCGSTTFSRNKWHKKQKCKKIAKASRKRNRH